MISPDFKGQRLAGGGRKNISEQNIAHLDNEDAYMIKMHSRN